MNNQEICKKQTRAAYQRLQKMYYELCSVYSSHLAHNSDEWQMIQQRKIALGNLLFTLNIDEPYTSEIEYLAKHHQKMNLPENTAKAKLDKSEEQKAISLYYESLIMQNASYHDQLLFWQMPDKLLSITDLDQVSFNSNYTERINGYYIALRAINVEWNLLAKLKDAAFNQVWHASISQNGSNQYDLHYGVNIPSEVKLGAPYRDLRK